MGGAVPIFIRSFNPTDRINVTIEVDRGARLC
jgi:hypothetical protein